VLGSKLELDGLVI